MPFVSFVIVTSTRSPSLDDEDRDVRKMPPLIAHWSPGSPSWNPGFLVIVKLELPVEAARRVERRRRGLAVRQRVELLVGGLEHPTEAVR